MLKGIIFDMDGVLVDTEHYHYQAWKNTFLSVNIELSQLTYNNKCRAQGRKNAIRNLIPNASESLIHELSLQKETYYKRALTTQGVTIFSDAIYLLRYLSTTPLLLAIASSSKTAEFVIKQTEFSNMFDVIVTGAHIKNNKPNPDIFNLARDKMNCSIDDVIVIEDSVSGIIASRRAGIDTIAINRNASLNTIQDSDIFSLPEISKISSFEKNNLAQSKTIYINSLIDAITYIKKRSIFNGVHANTKKP